MAVTKEEVFEAHSKGKPGKSSKSLRTSVLIVRRCPFHMMVSTSSRSLAASSDFLQVPLSLLKTPSNR